MPFEFDYLKGVVNFFEAQMGGELMQNSLECLRGEDESGIESPARFTGPLILMVGMWMMLGFHQETRNQQECWILNSINRPPSQQTIEGV